MTGIETKRSLTERERLVEKLRWQKFPVLDDGFVTLVDVMGDDSAIVQAARVSYGIDKRPCEACGGEGGDVDPMEGRGAAVGSWQPCGACSGTGFENDKVKGMKDRDLIRYLLRNRHTTPFEMAEIKILVRVPMDCWRQWIRHRTANVNEYSTRYTEAIDSMQTTKPDEWRLQSKSNKQGSSGFLPVDGPEIAGMSTGLNLSQEENELHEQAHRAYQHRLRAGVAKEQARKDLPLSNYTEAYWKIDLHNMFHFLGLRMHSHAQKEIRDYATTIGENIIKPLFPIAWEAFEDYRLGGMFLTRLDIEVVRDIAERAMDAFADELLPEIKSDAGEVISNKRELEECLEKLKRLGLLSG